jgi:aryl-alcohol dehydrogenase-like predicted oxidoreductase
MTNITLPTRTLGPWELPPIGLGAAGFSVGDTPPVDQALATVRAAVEAGVRLIDSAACYVPRHDAPGHNEAIIGQALRDLAADDVVVATKAGIRRTSSGGTIATDFTGDASPAALREACEDSLRALGVETLDLLQLHSPDEKVPLSESVGTMLELQHQGKVRAIGLCNVTLEQLREAQAVGPIASVQNRLSAGARDNLAMALTCADENLAFIAYSPLGGLGAGARGLGRDNPTFEQVAKEHGVSPQRIGLAWLLRSAPNILPIPGCRREATILDSVAATSLVLTDDQFALLKEAGPRMDT